MAVRRTLSAPPSNLHLLKPHPPVHEPCEVGVDGFDARHAVYVRGGSDEVGALHEFEAGLGEFEPCGVERAPLMREQDDSLHAVHFQQKLQLINDTLLFEVRLRVTREAGGAAGE